MLDKILFFVQEKIWYSVGFELRKRFSKSFKKIIHLSDGTILEKQITWYQYQSEFGTPHYWGEFEHVDAG